MTRPEQAAQNLQRVKEKVREASRVVVLTGAGISAESGVPTFRGAGGLWRQHKATDLATPEAFARDPQLVWDFYNYRREVLAPLQPNAAHKALVALEAAKESFVLLTQNIDGLHQAAGSENVWELHGNIWRVRCSRCGQRREDRRVPIPFPPLCQDCGGMWRPDVVWFGESLDPDLLRRAYEALEECDVMLVIGTSGVVQPAASMGLYAKENGAFVAEINLEPTPYSRALSVSLQGKAGDLVPRVVG
ncbi:NAD-dependent deacetylase [Desulfacinum hydrothermale DSM 13146]|uniref:NAD-dependent protein deacylase n=1 Tax=Desulfacinum hydrothermale DSM 13146 TaxID=1121390 RepID=A0A1W1X9M3_9BACT|nr:NAD-dependent deacylase [Desulfacinum hydrothermale]SMC20599.1 NAD-dependent deacetylase [Desulfacinum hydrothermale DSM 13146]